MSNLALDIFKTAEQQQHPLCVITPSVAFTEQLADELAFFATSSNVVILTFPDREILPYDRFTPHKDIISERLRLLSQLPSLKKVILLVAISTLMDRLPPANYIAKNSFMLSKEQTIDIPEFRNNLQQKGYYAVEQVLTHGEYAVRGSIIDVFPMGSKQPFRIDLFDNDIEAIYSFDPDTQRSLQEVKAISILPTKETCSSASATLFEYLPANSNTIILQDVHTAAETFWREINQRYEQLAHDIDNPIEPPKELFIPVPELFAANKKFERINIKETKKTLPDLTIDNKKTEPLYKLKDFLVAEKKRILFCADSIGRREMLLQLLKRISITPKQYNSWQEFLVDSRGEVPSPNGYKHGICVAPLYTATVTDEYIVIPETLLFGEQIVKHRKKTSEATIDSEAIIRDLTELSLEDPVVHIQYGIGRYKGLTVLPVQGQEYEFLTIEYAKDAKLYVPVASLHLISRYLGAEGKHAPLHQLGAKEWDKAKRKAQERIHDIAAELLEIYAKRAANTGFAFKKSAEQYQQFCAGFLFDTTEDQQKAIDATLQDMTSAKTMDRLICGDVGFGKTEVAMRAAFIAACNNKQTAILVPTTLLAQQHFATFQDRFASWSINVAVLSRFNTPKQQKEIIENLHQGKVDIVIGTHRLLQKDIAFKDLGLLIIDEEHRFGVKHKERLKALRANIDILTLTATPIPRTLNMALTSIRDLSIIATPPAKRLSIKTFVYKQQNAIIREAILREIMRGGQIYFLHNEVATIQQMADKIQQLLPEIKLAIGHGQMHERELERVMRDFYHQRYNLLLCTTIIESGLDIPTANTIIINRADKFGLAQLHQLRGRVGRSHHQAYAYLLIPEHSTITKDAEKRLEAFSNMEELGVGFSLAMHDLEIRGAGEILGEEQSGEIQEIGFNLYMEMLQKAIKGIDMNAPSAEPINIDLPIPALLPATYVHDINIRLVLYKRIASAKTSDALDTLQVELIDRFGLLPEQTKNLFAIAELKLNAEKLGVKTIKAGSDSGYIEFNDQPNIDHAALIELIQKHNRIYKLAGNNKLQFKLENAQGCLNLLKTVVRELYYAVNDM